MNLSNPPLSPFILLACAVCSGNEFQVCVTWKKKKKFFPLLSLSLQFLEKIVDNHFLSLHSWPWSALLSPLGYLTNLAFPG